MLSNDNAPLLRQWAQKGMIRRSNQFLVCKTARTFEWAKNLTLVLRA